MASVEITFDALGTRQLSRSLEVARDALTDLRPLGPDLIAVLRQEVLRDFASEGAYSGKRWRPLSERYKKWKARKHRENPANYPGDSILVLTGRLLNSLTQGTGAGVQGPRGGGTSSSRDAVREINRRFIVYGTGVPYAARQAKLGRPAIRLNNAGRERVVEVVRSHMVGAFRSAIERPEPFFLPSTRR